MGTNNSKVDNSIPDALGNHNPVRFQPYRDNGFIPTYCDSNLPENYDYLNGFRFAMHKPYAEYKALIESNIYDLCLKSQNIAELEEREVRNIYSLTSILAHKYIWGDAKNPKNTIPPILGRPWNDSSKALGIPPVLTHAAVDLWNWKLIDESGKFELDNLRSINTMCDGPNASRSEEWFYLIMVSIEGECSDLVELFEKTMDEFEKEDFSYDIIYDNMIKIKALLTHQRNLMKRIREHCEPELFYNQLRKYLWGSDKVDGGITLKEVELIEGDEPHYIDVKIEYGGGSAAQSSLIQAEDIFFGVKHPHDEFLKRMRDYMPDKHRKYLEKMETRINMREFLEKLIKISFDYKQLMPLYNECVDLIADFRKVHKGVVAEYIIQQMPKNVDGTGTGGTPLQTYLREKVDETEQVKIE